jgi:hypothetical protein
MPRREFIVLLEGWLVAALDAASDSEIRMQKGRHEIPRHDSTWSLISPLAASVILALLVQVYAGITLRGLYADGAYVVTRLASQQSLVHPARWTATMIAQWPVWAAMGMGVQTPHGIAVVFSLATNLLPGLIILLCLPVLPTGKKHFLVFPAFVYFAGILSAQFASVTEGLVATSYFWLLLSLITFGPLTILRLVLIAALALGILDLHEQMSFLGPILFVTCAIRWRAEPRLLPRIILALAAVCALASTVIGTYLVFNPLNVAERDSFVAAFLALRWLYEPGFGYNLPSVLGILAVPCIFLATVRPAWKLATTGIFAALSISLAFAAFWLDWLIVPTTQWAARDNGALMSLPLAALLLFARVHKPLAAAITGTPARGMVAILGLAVSLWHVAATEQWSAFLAHFANVLQSHDGIVAWDKVIEPRASRQAKLAAKMWWDWTNPDLSLLALPRSCVNSVIANPTWYVDWDPYTLSNVATMPAIPGVTYTYLLPLDQQQAACAVIDVR